MATRVTQVNISASVLFAAGKNSGWVAEASIKRIRWSGVVGKNRGGGQHTVALWCEGGGFLRKRGRRWGGLRRPDHVCVEWCAGPMDSVPTEGLDVCQEFLPLFNDPAGLFLVLQTKNLPGSIHGRWSFILGVKILDVSVTMVAGVVLRRGFLGFVFSLIGPRSRVIEKGVLLSSLV